MSLEKVFLESPSFQRLLERKAHEVTQQVTEQVTQQVTQAVTRKSILRLLHNRFSAIPKKVSTLLDAIEDQAKLEHLLDLAPVCRDLKVFREAMDE